MPNSGNPTLSVCFEPARVGSSRILLVCRDPSLVAHLQCCLDGMFNLVTAPNDASYSALPLEGSFAVVILEAGLDECSIDAVSRMLAETSPATTLLVLGDPCDLTDGAGNRDRNHADHPPIRFLPDPYVPGILEQLVADYAEHSRLRTVELTLTRELDQLRNRVNELSRQASEEGLQSTASLLRLYHVVSGLSGLTTPQEIGELVVSTAASMLKSRRVSLLVPDANREYLTVAAAVGVPHELLERIQIPIGRPITGEVFVTARSMLVQNRIPPQGWHERVDSELIPDLPFISMALTGPDSVVAVLNISDPISAGAYTEESLTGLHAITEAATIALANQIRGQERNEARDGIMMAMAKLAESRDPETGAHLERVQHYCRIVAEELAKIPKYDAVITPEFIATLVWSSPLHDIGKVGVPDEILLKPGRLTPAEFEIMKRHSSIGGDTIRSLIERGRRHDFLQMAMDIAYYHHEKYDGTGYPRGLAGDAIPLPARIAALADVYDALTSVRVYKNAMSHIQAAELIRRDRGSHLDPDVVDAFLQREKEFEKLATELADTRGEDTPRPGE